MNFPHITLRDGFWLVPVCLLAMSSAGCLQPTGKDKYEVKYYPAGPEIEKSDAP